MLLLACATPSPRDKGPTRTTDTARPAIALSVEPAWQVTPEALRSPQHHPTLAWGDGLLAVAWDEETNPPGGYLRLFGADGTPHTDYQRFTPCPEQVPCRPDVIAVEDGFRVGWADDAGVHVAAFDRTLTQAGSVTTLEATPEDERLEAPDLAPAGDGGVLAAWFGSDRLDGGATATYRLSRLDPDGTVSNRVLDVGPDGGSPPDITPNGAAGAVITWVSRTATDDGVSSTVWMADLDPDGDELHRREVWTSPTVVTRPMVAVLGSLRAVVWREDRPERVSWLRLFPGEDDPHAPFLLAEGAADKPVVELVRGYALAAFDIATDDGAEVLLQPFDVASGTPLQAPVAVFGGGGAEQRPALAADDDGVWVALREEPEGRGTPGNIRVVRATLR